jgi:tetratricopeptide (TPR) repeat protein
MKYVPSSTGALLLAALLSPIAAQDPPTGGAPPQAAPQAPKTVGESLVNALIQGDLRSMTAAVESVHKAGKEGRASLRQLLERTTPATAALPAPEKGAKPDTKALSEPLSEEFKGVIGAIWSEDAAKAEEASKKLAAAATANAADAQKVAARVDALLGASVLRVFREQQETRAIYAGQYAALRDLGPAGEQLLRKWVTSPSPRMAPALVKSTSIRALRDVVEKPDEALMAMLKKVATDKFEVREVSREAGWALAQFGDRSLIDPMIAQFEETAKGKTGPEMLQALSELADTHYQLRDYEKAVDAFKRQITAIEQTPHGAPANLPTIYYNACCSMALAGKSDEAFEHLDKAIEASKKAGQNALARRTVEVDMDIESLRKDPRYAKALEKMAGK